MTRPEDFDLPEELQPYDRPTPIEAKLIISLGIAVTVFSLVVGARTAGLI